LLEQIVADKRASLTVVAVISREASIRIFRGAYRVFRYNANLIKWNLPLVVAVVVVVLPAVIVGLVPDNGKLVGFTRKAQYGTQEQYEQSRMPRSRCSSSLIPAGRLREGESL